MPLSYSQLHLYQTCPKQYEFSVIKKIPRGISAGESFGSSVHNALAKWGRVEMQHLGAASGQGERSTGNGTFQLPLFQEAADSTPVLLTPKTLSGFWHTSFIVEGYESKADADSARERGEKLMDHFYDWWKGEEREVLAVESGFVWKDSKDTEDSEDSEDEMVITGRFDRVERTSSGVRVIDYKTTSPRTQEDVDTDLQLSIYALAAMQEFGLKDEGAVELVLLFLREEGVTAVRTKRSTADLTEASARISTLATGMQDRDFTANPSQKVCSRCPYKSICEDSVV